MKTKKILLPLLVVMMIISCIGFGVSFAYATDEPVKAETLLLQGGNVVGTKPAYVTDEKVTFLDLKDHGKKEGNAGTVDHPAYATVNTEKLPGVETYAKSDYTMIRAKNIVFTLKFDNIVASDYGKFEMDMVWSDWSFSHHDLYIYGSGTTTFVNSEGRPEGYAKALHATGPDTHIPVIIDNVAKLANSEGIIENIFIMYGGNTQDSTNEVLGTRDGSQPWINEIKFSVPEKFGTQNLAAGNYAGTVMPEYVNDPNVTYIPTVKKDEAYPPYANVAPYARGDINSKNFPEAESYKKQITETVIYDILRVKNILFSLDLGGIDVSKYDAVEVGFSFTDWGFGQHDFYIYGTGTTKFTDENGKPTGYIIKVTIAKPNKMVKFMVGELNKLADENGKIEDIFILYGGNTKDTDTEVFGTWDGTSIFISELNLVYNDKSLRYQAGLLSFDTPEYITDTKVTPATMRDHGEPYQSFGYVEHPAFVPLSSSQFDPKDVGEDGKRGTFDFPTYGDTYETRGIRAQKILYPIHVGSIKASKYAQFQLTFYWPDWNNGTHQFYLFPSGTTTFVDEQGNPTKYAAELRVTGPDTRQKFEVNDLSLLADKDGNIKDILILYWGNIRDTEEEIIGTWNNTPLFVNEVNFLLEEDVKYPTLSEEYIKKDISELLPVGNGWTTSLKSENIAEGQDGYGKLTVSASGSITKFDAIDFMFTPTYDKHFSSVIVFNSVSSGNKADDSGISFWISDSKITIVGTNGSSKTNATIGSDSFPEGLLASGVPVKFSLRAIPCYLEGVKSGVQAFVYVNGLEDPLLTTYIPLANLSLGRYTKIMNQDLGNDFSVKFAPFEQVVKTPEEIMNVSISSNRTVYDKERASLTLDYTSFKGETVSDIMIEGNATFDKARNMLKFTKPGKVKLSFKVTNSFGEFTSNVLEIEYTGGDIVPGGDTKPGEDTKPDGQQGGGCGCGSSIDGGFIIGGVLLIASLLVIKLKRKHD